MTRRLLPIGVIPQPGEALESWLGTLAQRLDMPYGELLAGIGSTINGDVDLRRPGLSVYLAAPEAAAVTASTGIDPSPLHQMTLARYDGHLTSIDRTGKHLRWSTWHPSRSRFCPACLAASGGRWQLCWRLPWVFVCDVHDCLLEDTCPTCRQPQSVSPRWLLPAYVPHLQRCNRWMRHNGTRVPCGGELKTAAHRQLLEADPLAVAHARLARALAGASTRFGVYARSPASSLQVLADLRVLSARMLASAESEKLDDFLGAEAGVSVRARVAEMSLDLGHWGKPEVFTTRAPALITAIGLALALTVLGAESIRDAGDSLRSVLGGRGARNRTATPGALRFGNLSPVLEAVQLSAISSHFVPSNTLRFRTTTEFPRYPRTDGIANVVAVRAVPTALWRDWSLRLVAKQRLHLRTVCSSLSTLLLIVGSRTSVTDACAQLGGAVKGSQQIKVLDAMRRHPLWPNIAEAIVRLADYLAAHPGPIDYQRRRELHYAGLLPPTVWTQIGDRADLGPTELDSSGRLARAWLFERISGRPADMSGFTRGIRRPRQQREDLVARFTPAVIRALDEEADRFLHTHGIFDEPVQWSPPIGMVSDLKLPGPDLADVSIKELHGVLGVESGDVTATARHFGVPTPCIRLLLERFPIPPPAQRPIPQLRRLRACLSRQELIDLHHRDAVTLKAIAARFGVGPRAVSALAREYGLEVPGFRPTLGSFIDPTWLRCEHVDRHRTLTDIADELGASLSAVSRFAARHGIPVIRDPRVFRDPRPRRVTISASRTPPRRRSSAIDADWLRREYVVNRRAASDLAHELGVATSTVHRRVNKLGFRLAPRPAPVTPKKKPKPRPRCHVDSAWLRTQYCDQRRTLTDIADELGISPSTMSALAKREGLQVRRGPRPAPRRPKQGKPRSTVDLEWLHREFEVHGRSLADMADEAGVTASTLRRQARRHHIGDARRRAYQETAIDLDWLRHEHVDNHRTLSDLAREVGMATSSLRRQAVKHGIGAPRRRRRSARDDRLTARR